MRIESLVQGYDGRKVLDGVSVEVEPGKIVSILGPNGCGKSTLIKTVSGAMKPMDGTIEVDGRDVSVTSQKELAKLIGYVPQKGSITDYVKVFDAVLLGRAPYMSWSFSKNDFIHAAGAIRELGLKDLADSYVNDLSGGQMQKVMMARVLTQDPRYYILDEPTSALDLRNQIDVLSTLKRIVRTRDAGGLVALHDLNLAMHFSDHVVMIKDGNIVSSGTPEEAITEDSIRTVYNVEAEILDGKEGKFVHTLMGSERSVLQTLDQSLVL